MDYSIPIVLFAILFKICLFIGLLLVFIFTPMWFFRSQRQQSKRLFVMGLILVSCGFASRGLTIFLVNQQKEQEWQVQGKYDLMSAHHAVMAGFAATGGGRFEKAQEVFDSLSTLYNHDKISAQEIANLRVLEEAAHANGKISYEEANAIFLEAEKLLRSKQEEKSHR